MANDKLVVRKSNEIVQKTINKFNKQQNKLMCVLLGKYVNLQKDELIDSEISIADIRKIFELEKSGQNNTTIRTAIKNFAECSSVGCLEYNKKGEAEYVWYPYFKQVRLSEDKCIFSWNEMIKPYLIKLKSNYTQYISDNYLALKSIYGQNLYEQMKSYHKLINQPYKDPGIVELDIEYLRKLMRTEDKYADQRRFVQQVVRKAVKDINDNTDIYIEASRVKDGKITFTIKSKDKYFDYNGCWLNTNEVEDIISRQQKSKIYELAKIKKENKDYYTLLRQGNKSDYDIILNFIDKDDKSIEKINISDGNEECIINDDESFEKIIESFDTSKIDTPF